MTTHKQDPIATVPVDNKQYDGCCETDQTYDATNVGDNRQCFSVSFRYVLKSMSRQYY